MTRSGTKSSTPIKHAEPDNVARRVQCRLEALQDTAPTAVFSALVAEGLAELPPPGAGQTLERWRALAAVCACDLSLGKLYEAHTDALAILHELRQPLPLGGTWGVWAAEPPSARLTLKFDGSDSGVVEGRKAWCAGAGVVDHALVTAWDGERGSYLVTVDLRQEGIQLDGSGWRAVGMADTASLDVLFDQVPVRVIGRPRAYLERPGFWHGGIGIAACWYGAAVALGEALRGQIVHRPNPHALAHLGAVDVALAQAAATLREAASQIDARPDQAMEALALRVRGVVEVAANEVLLRAGRALGATPFCRDAHFGRLAADLPVFLRQSHAERDLERLGQACAEDAADWQL